MFNNFLLINLLISLILNAQFHMLQSFSITTTRGEIRQKRQIDLTLTAEHDDKADDTEIVLEAIANLWRSTDGNTQIEGSAKVVHKSNSFQDGNNHYQARLHLHHDYANGNPDDWRLGVRVIFT